MVQIITPYVFEDATLIEHKKSFLEYNVYYEKDTEGLGSDLMYQKMWEKFPNDDIFILHADMSLLSKDWLEQVVNYVNKYPEAGIFGCLLLYPDKKHVQSAGGRFVKGVPDHFGSGLIVETGDKFKEHLEEDTGQFDNVREVAWTTFGGCYIRRDVINEVKHFDAEYTWSYNRDVDYCLRARKAGYRIYQIPVKLIHHESKDNKIIKMNDPEKVQEEARNLAILQKNWSHTEFYESINILRDM